MADPQQGGATNAAASVATQIPAPSLAAAAPRGLAAGQDERIEREQHAEGQHIAQAGHGTAHPLTVEPVEPAMAAPSHPGAVVAGVESPDSSANSTASPSTEVDGGDLSEKHTTHNGAASIDEKVQDALMLEKERKQQAQQDGSDGGKGKKAAKDKKKKKAAYDKRDPVEIALENPELAHLDPEGRKIIAEQIAVIKRPPAGFFELFRYSTKFEIFLNVVGIICAIAAGVAQ